MNWWNSPYSLREKIDFFHYRIAHPKEHSSALPEYGLQNIEKTITLNSTKERNFSIIFTGDLMPFGDQPPQHSERIAQFLRSSDYIVVNLEGVATERKRFLALTHRYTPLVSYLKAAFGMQTILNVANNHSSDFGREVFDIQNQKLRDEGFVIVGDQPTPLTIEDKVSLFAATTLSNQFPIINKPQTGDLLTEIHFDTEHTYNIVMPHWGYEMQLHPTGEQIETGLKLLSNVCDSVIGNHAHTPHPVYITKNQVLATSLGNLCYLNRNPNHWFGALVKLTFTIDSSLTKKKPFLAEVEVKYTKQTLLQDGSIYLDEVAYPDYRAARRTIRFTSKGYIKDLLK